VEATTERAAWGAEMVEAAGVAKGERRWVDSPPLPMGFQGKRVVVPPEGLARPTDRTS
tara:strand:+ start:2755 stop:2928 length:174 start_codon:yes stop_codon:yes gene_type:complete